MIITRQDERNQRVTRHLAQVDLDEMNKRRARKMGEHHARHHVWHFAEVKRRLVRNCRHWPLMRSLRPDGSCGDILFIKPSNVQETLVRRARARGWCQSPANLAKDGILGPFNFSNIRGETHRIDDKAWKVPENCEGVKSGRLDIDNLSQITPLH